MSRIKRNKRAFSVAPMLKWSDKHCRYFHRLISKHAYLYTEMVVDKTIILGDHHRYLKYNDCEHPIALQIGGSKPDELYKAVQIALSYNYDEINFNIGCPSDKVQTGKFGACLMNEPELAKDCVAAIKQAASGKCDVSVKCRLGVDEQDTEETLDDFVSNISDAGVKIFIIHARKAWLEGLSPKENRELPKLDYDRVIRLKQDFPDNEIIINGGIKSLDEAIWFLDNTKLDGVMLGREVYHNPYILSEVDRLIYGDEREVLSRLEIIEMMKKYTKTMVSKGVRLNSITRHIMGLYFGVNGAKSYRRYIGENSQNKAYKKDEIVSYTNEFFENAFNLIAR